MLKERKPKLVIQNIRILFLTTYEILIVNNHFFEKLLECPYIKTIPKHTLSLFLSLPSPLFLFSFLSRQKLHLVHDRIPIIVPAKRIPMIEFQWFFLLLCSFFLLLLCSFFMIEFQLLFRFALNRFKFCKYH